MYQVIIADDETKIRSGLANLFPWNQLGFEITGSFSNGRDAYDFALSNPVDLILSDIRMPSWTDWSSRSVCCPGKK